MSTSAYRNIRDDLAVQKWGWVIYRCSYDDADDETRAQYRTCVEANSRGSIAQSDAPEIADRLEYFIKSDKEVLQNLPGFLEKGWSMNAFVKIVDADWEPSSTIAAGDQQIEEQDVFEPIDGCTEKDVGWMRIAPSMLNAEFYHALEGDEMAWDHQFYERPPTIVRW
ncbi:hypothetical protein N0V83_004750 [Neocucurbitaria cava]|uniref:Uncharacterized protein n=1 Tax=Neocucurbitaria cava TaxID=798079 RepID=A0A9W8YA88_9PLEO|nr:hypothetical protein N0V83_004750 [Neocucurbitaria cava]